MVLLQLKHQGWAHQPTSEQSFKSLKNYPKTQQLPKGVRYPQSGNSALVNYEEVFLTNGDLGGLF